MSAGIRDSMMALLLCVLVCSLGRASSPQSCQQWQPPVPLGEVNSSGFNDKSPFLSFDGLTLYFSRENEPAGYFARLYQATRETPDGLFGDVREIIPLTDGGGHVSCPWVSADGLRMYYYSTSGLRRWLRMSQRGGLDEPWPPASYVSELNALGSLANPTLTEDERVIVFSGLDLHGGRGGWDLWTASRPDRDSPFSDVTNLRTLNTTSWDMHPSITPDGLVLYFGSNRSGRFQIFRACRNSQESQFAHVQHMALLDTPDGMSTYPSISADGTTLYYGSQKEGGLMDLWVSHAVPAFYVDAVQGLDRNNGLSPRRAFATIQRAIRAARDGDVIGVYPGVYREEIRFLGKAITVQSIGDAAVIEAPGGFGASFYMGEGPDTVLRNVVIRDCYVAVFCAHSAPTITNVTATGNVWGVEAYGQDLPSISNSIFWGNTESDLYGCQAKYSCIERSSDGQGNFSSDPLFVDAGSGDYHLLSARGRYWPEHDVWVLDDVTSPCVDAGDPAADFSAEPKPNGNRRNVGAHGGTAFAERSEPPFTGDITGDGVFDIADYDLFLDLWEQHTQPPPPPSPKRR